MKIINKEGEFLLIHEVESGEFIREEYLDFVGEKTQKIIGIL